VIEAVKAGGYGKREIIIRVNALATPWGETDLFPPDSLVLRGLPRAAATARAGD
jgi:citrate lyase beta subunit